MERACLSYSDNIRMLLELIRCLLRRFAEFFTWHAEEEIVRSKKRTNDVATKPDGSNANTTTQINYLRQNN